MNAVSGSVRRITISAVFLSSQSVQKESSKHFPPSFPQSKHTAEEKSSGAVGMQLFMTNGSV